MFKNKIVKFRFYEEKKEDKLILSSILSLIFKKYNPEVYYIKQLQEIREIIHLFSFELVDEILKNKELDTELSDLYSSFLSMKSNWNRYSDDLKSYILICFKLEFSYLKSKINF